MIDLYRVLPEEMDDLVVKLGHPRYRAGQLLRALYHESPRKMSDLHQIPTSLRDALVTAGYTMGSEDEVHRVVSEDGHTTKLLLKFDVQWVVSFVQQVRWVLKKISKLKRLSPRYYTFQEFYVKEENM